MVIAKAFGVGFQRDRPARLLPPSASVEPDRRIFVADCRRDAVPGYHAWHAACADFLRRLSGAPKPRKEAYDAAIVASQNFAERAYLAGSAAN
jgi:hypothetical protein